MHLLKNLLTWSRATVVSGVSCENMMHNVSNDNSPKTFLSIVFCVVRVGGKQAKYKIICINFVGKSWVCICVCRRWLTSSSNIYFSPSSDLVHSTSHCKTLITRHNYPSSFFSISKQVNGMKFCPLLFVRVLITPVKK